MPPPTLLPFTTPRKSGTNSSVLISRPAFRLTEKFLLLLVFSGFITLCFGAIFFLPDSSKLLSGVFFHSQRASIIGSGPKLDGGRELEGDKLNKIREDHEKVLREAKDTLQKLPEQIKQEIKEEKQKVVQESANKKEAAPRLPNVVFRKPVGATGREPSDPQTRERQAKIKEVHHSELLAPSFCHGQCRALSTSFFLVSEALSAIVSPSVAAVLESVLSL